MKRIVLISVCHALCHWLINGYYCYYFSDDSEHDSDFGDEGHASPPPPPFKTGGWC